jgi:peroxiredoxin family protein
MIAAILASGEPERLYTGLSLLVSAAADGRQARGLATFGALELLLDDALEERGRAARGDVFGRTLAELRATAAELDDVRIWACAAAVETGAIDRDRIEERLDGVLSTPRFLREVGDAQLVVV